MTAAVLPLVLVLLSVPLAQEHAATASEVTLTATSANVGGPGSPMKIRIFRWSTDEERNPVLAALNPAPQRGAGAAAGARGAAARGARAGGARGRGRGPAVPLTPAAAMTAALRRSPTLGYIWTNDITGYSIKYAWRAPLPEGGERIVLATDRRLGAHTPGWKPVAATETEDEFTVFELRLDGRGLGEGKTSLTTKVVTDNEAKTVALENYAATTAMLQNVKR